MPELTEAGRSVIADLANRHGFSPDAIQHMLVAVMNGNGQMAQFSHPEFAGSGQWMSGGMTMIGDMFNNYLKGRIQSLCSDIAVVLQNQGVLFQTGSFQSQSQGGYDSQQQTAGGVRGSSTLFVPDPAQNWWPKELGSPNATGNQNQTHYAYFGEAGRLAVKTGSSVWVYDTLQHQIGGFSQQQGGNGGFSFSSQFGNVLLSSLPVVSRDGQSVQPATQSPTMPSDSFKDTVVSPSSTAAAGVDVADESKLVAADAAPLAVDILGAIEKLGELKAKGVLTEAEFAEKKKELLARL